MKKQVITKRINSKRLTVEFSNIDLVLLDKVADSVKVNDKHTEILVKFVKTLTSHLDLGDPEEILTKFENEEEVKPKVVDKTPLPPKHPKVETTAKPTGQFTENPITAVIIFKAVKNISTLDDIIETLDDGLLETMISKRTIRKSLIKLHEEKLEEVGVTFHVDPNRYYAVAKRLVNVLSNLGCDVKISAGNKGDGFKTYETSTTDFKPAS